ncbi:carbohydrate esterase family 4 protein [Mycena vitilis]|nr:carbohydrate esterase family 4 protein [Mycena vitilis]
MLITPFVFLLGPILSFAQDPVPKAVVYSGCTVPNAVALTFDDGPYKYGPMISDLLASKSAKGTFFVNGYNYDCIYDNKVATRLQYVYNAGHQICSHTWSHPDLTNLTAFEITEELRKIDDALYTVLGINTTFLRPPYGNYNTTVRELAPNKTFILWDFDSGDSVGKSVNQSEKLYNKTIQDNPTNILALNHETEKTTAMNLTAYAIDALQAANYSLVTVAECLGLEPYTNIGPIGIYNDTTWFCPEDEEDD